MKVAIITSYWKNSAGGGVKTYVVNLVDALKDRGLNVNVLFREGVDPQNYQGRQNKIAFSLSCFQYLRTFHPDVIHTQGAWYCLLPGIIYKRFNDCILVHTFHTEPINKLSLPMKIFFQSLLNNCDCVTFVSIGLFNQVVEVEELSFQKTMITYGGVSKGTVTDEEVDCFKNLYNLPNTAIIVLVQAFTANKIKAEGLKLVILAIGILKEKYPDLILLITRDGEYSDELKNFSYERDLKNHIIFTGDVDNPFVPIDICDIFLFPWLGRSGVGLALLEAMSFGKPILVTDSGYGSEAIEDGINGLYVEPNPASIAKKIDFLLKNREFGKHLGRCAKKKIEEKFTWKKTADRLLLAYGLI